MHSFSCLPMSLSGSSSSSGCLCLQILPCIFTLHRSGRTLAALLWWILQTHCIHAAQLILWCLFLISLSESQFYLRSWNSKDIMELWKRQWARERDEGIERENEGGKEGRKENGGGRDRAYKRREERKQPTSWKRRRDQGCLNDWEREGERERGRGGREGLSEVLL